MLASLALRAMLEAAGNRRPHVDPAWADELRPKHRERTASSGKAPETSGWTARFTRARF